MGKLNTEIVKEKKREKKIRRIHRRHELHLFIIDLGICIINLTSQLSFVGNTFFATRRKEIAKAKQIYSLVICEINRIRCIMDKRYFINKFIF